MSPASPERRKPRLSLSRQATKEGIAAELLVLLETVTEDGVITDDEVKRLENWLSENAHSDLPGIEFLRTMVNHILADHRVTPEERNELYKAVEKVLLPEARRLAIARRSAVESLKKAEKRTERRMKRPVASANFMVAGVLYEGRADVVDDHVRPNHMVFLARDRNNQYDKNAIEVRLSNGMQIGYVPREDAARLAPLLDSECTHRACVAKILQGRQAPIPVVQAKLFQAGAKVDGAISQGEIPTRVVARAKRSGCFSFALVALAIIVVACLIIW